MTQKTWMLSEIVEQLERCGYECEGGPLRLNIAFQALKEMAAKETDKFLFWMPVFDGGRGEPSFRWVSEDFIDDQEADS